MFKDFFGTPIQIGDAGIRVDAGKVAYRPYKKVVVKKFDESRRYDPIGILAAGSPRITWINDERLIIQGSLKVQIFDDMDKKVETILDI